MRISELSRRTGASVRSLPQPLPVCEEELLALYQDKLQDIEHQVVVLTALHTRLEERIACLQRQIQAE